MKISDRTGVLTDETTRGQGRKKNILVKHTIRENVAWIFFAFQSQQSKTEMDQKKIWKNHFKLSSQSQLLVIQTCQSFYHYKL